MGEFRSEDTEGILEFLVGTAYAIFADPRFGTSGPCQLTERLEAPQGLGLILKAFDNL